MISRQKVELSDVYFLFVFCSQSWLVWSSDSEGEESGGVSFTELWRTREAPAVSLDEWLPQSTQNKVIVIYIMYMGFYSKGGLCIIVEILVG